MCTSTLIRKGISQHRDMVDMHGYELSNLYKFQLKVFFTGILALLLPPHLALRCKINKLELLDTQVNSLDVI